LGTFYFGFGRSNCGSDEHVRWPIRFAALRVAYADLRFSPELLLGFYNVVLVVVCDIIDLGFEIVFLKGI